MCNERLSAFVDAFYDSYESSGYCTEEDQCLPPVEVLREVCQILIDVSCMREEGRYPRFRVCFIRPDADLLDAYLYAHAYLFENPVVFSPKDMNKLAPAINPDMSYLMLDITRKPYRAVGEIAAYTTWEKIMVREITSGIRMPMIPNILVNGPGALEGCFGETSLVNYRNGECIYLRKDTFTATPIAKVLAEGSHVHQKDRLKFIYQVLWRAHKNGHGGHFFIVPSAESCEELTTYKYKMRSCFPGERTEMNEEEAEGPGLLEYIEHALRKDKQKDGTHTNRDIGTYANMIAGFTLVDGAVILNKDLDLIGFGAETHPAMSRRSVKMSFMRQDNTEDKTRNFNDNGMRHRACYNFCYDVEGAVGVILSHDGGVEVCTKIDGKVLVYDNVGLPLL